MGKYELELEDLNELQSEYGITIKGRQPKKKNLRMKREQSEKKNSPDWKRTRKKTKPF